MSLSEDRVLVTRWLVEVGSHRPRSGRLTLEILDRVGPFPSRSVDALEYAVGWARQSAGAAWTPPADIPKAEYFESVERFLEGILMDLRRDQWRYEKEVAAALSRENEWSRIQSRLVVDIGRLRTDPERGDRVRRLLNQLDALAAQFPDKVDAMNRMRGDIFRALY